MSTAGVCVLARRDGVEWSTVSPGCFIVDDVCVYVHVCMCCKIVSMVIKEMLAFLINQNHISKHDIDGPVLGIDTQDTLTPLAAYLLFELPALYPTSE